MRTLTWVVAVIALCLGCKDKSGAKQTAEAAAAVDQMSAKLEGYVECLNSLSNRAFEARERYFSWCADTGPTGTEERILGTNTFSADPKRCAAAVTAAKPLLPPLPALEEAGVAFSAAAEALAPLLKEADDYYTRENYKDDAMKKGQELHPKLVAAWNAFSQADANLRAQVRVMNRKMHEDDLARIEKEEGRKQAYFIRRALLAAQDLVESAKIKAIANVDLPKLEASIAEMEKATQELDDYRAANRPEVDPVVGASSVAEYCGQLIGSAKKLARHARDKTDIKDSRIGTDSEWTVDGTPAQVVQRYNKLVDAANRLR